MGSLSSVIILQRTLLAARFLLLISPLLGSATHTGWLSNKDLRPMSGISVFSSSSQIMFQPELQLNGSGSDGNIVGSDANIVDSISKLWIDSYRSMQQNRRMLNMCTTKDISISQGRDNLPGIPHYVVQIVNTCMSGCPPSNIHVSCGWFASAPLVNPSIFRRLTYNDCLVNGGKPLKYGDIIRFQYANSFMYPLRLKSAKFC